MFVNCCLWLIIKLKFFSSRHFGWVGRQWMFGWDHSWYAYKHAHLVNSQPCCDRLVSQLNCKNTVTLTWCKYSRYIYINLSVLLRQKHEVCIVHYKYAFYFVYINRIIWWTSRNSIIKQTEHPQISIVERMTEHKVLYDIF